MHYRDQHSIKANKKQNKASALRKESERASGKKEPTRIRLFQIHRNEQWAHHTVYIPTHIWHSWCVRCTPKNHKSNLLCIEIGLKVDPSSILIHTHSLAHSLIRLHKLLTHSFYLIWWSFRCTSSDNTQQHYMWLKKVNLKCIIHSKCKTFWWCR